MPSARESSRTYLLRLCALVAVPVGLISPGIPQVHMEDQIAVPVLGSLSSPQGITSDPRSAVFIALANGQITQLLARNTAESLAETGGRPVGVASNAAGDLYVADSGRKAILLIRPGDEINIVTDQCDGKPLVSPERITVAPDGAVYFTDPPASRVCRIDRQNKATVIVADIPGPTGIVASADANEIFLADRTGRIWKLKPDGSDRTLLATLTDEGQPDGMARDREGNLYIARDGGGKVSVLSAEGKLVTSYLVPGRHVSDLAFGGADLKNLYIAASDTGTIYSLRVANRSQRLPWEPDEPLSISAPVDGAILNHNDGDVVPGGLRITVEGTSHLTGPVRINGVSVLVHQGQFQSSLVVTDRETKITAEAQGRHYQIQVLWDRDSCKRYRFSTDDNIWFLKDIAQHSGSYSSIFENSYLGFWRDMHRKFGTRVHFNIYYETEGFNLSQMPDKYRPEWQKNADWIQLTFHARADSPDRPYLHASDERVRQDYRLVTRQIERFAGPEVLSPVTTVHWGEITRAGARALHEEGVRVLAGYFTACDDLPCVSYYLPLAQWRYLTGRDYWKDTREGLTFVRHDIVINTVPLDQIVAHLEQVAADPHQAEVMELMIHEQYFYPEYRAYEPDYRQRVERALEWVTQHGYKPVFYDDGFLGASAGK